MAKRWDVIAGLIREHGLTRGAEIGVKSGRLSGELLDRCPDLHLTCIDPWAGPYPGLKGPWDEAHHPVHERRFDSIAARYPGRVLKVKATSIEAAADVPDGWFDFVFIDALHTYPAVQADIAAWWPKVRRGGFMTGHDYGHPGFPGVKRAVDEAFGTVGTGSDHTWFIQV